MIYYILEEYKNGIYKKNNMRLFKELKLEEKVMLILLISSIIGFLGFILFGKIIVAAISVAVLIVDTIVIMKYADTHWGKFTNMDSMEKYKEEKIDRIINLLKDERIDMYDKKSIKWLIRMCNVILKKSEKIIFLNPIKTFFSMIIYPIIAAVAAIVIKDMNPNDILKIATLVVGILTVIFAMFFMIYPSIDEYMNKKNKMIETFKDDLEYILIKL